MCYTTRTWSLKFHGNEFETMEIIINVIIIVVLKSFLTVLNINPYYLTPRFFLIRTIGSCDVTCSIYFLSPQSGKVICLPWVSGDPSVVFPPRTICFPQGIQRSLLSCQRCILYSYRIVVWLLVSYWNITTILVTEAVSLEFSSDVLLSLFIPLFSLKCAPLLPQCSATRILEHWDDCNTQINKGKRTQVFTSIAALLLLDRRYSVFLGITINSLANDFK